jgi:hypothetical protein
MGDSPYLLGMDRWGTAQNRLFRHPTVAQLSRTSPRETSEVGSSIVRPFGIFGS